MQGQSSPVQVKDPYTGSIVMHVGSSCKHTGVYKPSKNNQKLIDEVTRKQKQNKISMELLKIIFSCNWEFIL